MKRHIWISSSFLDSLVGQSSLVVSTGTTKEITSSSECSGVSTITISGGHLIVRASCTISGTLTVDSSGTIQVVAGVTMRSNRADFRGSATGTIRGTLYAPTIVVETSATLDLVQGSSITGLATLSILTQGRFVSYDHSVTLTTLTVNNAYYMCEYRCIVTVTNAALTSSNFLANGVSSDHQDCGNAHSTTVASGGNHAGCSGEHSCCTTSNLTPVGSYKYPRDVGFKGGMCTDDGAGLGGGSWELTFSKFTTLSGINNVQANGGNPDSTKTLIGGGGSGGTILISMPCGASVEDAFRLQANGGNAITNTAQPAFGGSAGRISYICTSGTNSYRSFAHIYTAYGGMNAGANGWGAAGTINLPDRWTNFWGTLFYDHVIHIYERTSNYNQSPTPYYPATFIELKANEVNDEVLWIRTDTRSDIIYFAKAKISYGITIEEAGTTMSSGHGTMLNANGSFLSLTRKITYDRRAKSLTPPQPGICLAFYQGKYLPRFFSLEVALLT